MARQEINIGTIPTGAGGDTVRLAHIKINDMTEELYAAIGEGGGKVDTVAGVQADTAKDIPKAELATALGVDEKADKTATETALGNKVDKAAGKGLSSNDFTTAEKTKLSSLSNLKDQGIGGPAIPVPEGDCNKAVAEGNYRTIPATLNGRGVYAILEVFDYGDNGTSKIQRLTATYGNTVGDAMWFRTGTDKGARWSDWRRIVGVGDFGVGSEKLSFCQDANAVTESGSLAVGPETANCVGTYGTLRTEFYEKSSGNFTQIVQSLNGQGEWFRSSINGAATPWRIIAINRSETTAGTMPRAPAGTNLNVLPDYCHRVWIDSTSFWGPSAADYLVEHTFIQPGYAWQTAQALNPDNPGIWTRVQNAGNWSPWAAPAVAPKRYKSAGLTFTNGQLQAVQHGLGAIPFSLQIFAVPVVDQASWTAGIRISPSSGYTVGADATQVYIKVASTGLTVFDAQSGAVSNLIPANWRIEVRAST